MSKNKPTDLMEYGFKGKVKSVTTINYINLEQKNGIWQIDDEKVISKWKMTFNQEGNITEMKEYYRLSDTAWTEATTKTDFSSGRKSNYTKINSLGQITDLGTYAWIDNFNYELEVVQKNGITVKSHAKLNKRFREKSGGYSYVDGGSTIFSESYKNKLKASGEIVSSTFTDNLTGDKYVVKYTGKKKDNKGNMIRVALIYKKGKKLKRLSVREFQYYN